MATKYCFTCGHKLTVREYFFGYDEESGKPQYHTKYVCEHVKWYELIHIKSLTRIDYD